MTLATPTTLSTFPNLSPSKRIKKHWDKFQESSRRNCFHFRINNTMTLTLNATKLLKHFFCVMADRRIPNIGFVLVESKTPFPPRMILQICPWGLLCHNVKRQQIFTFVRRNISAMWSRITAAQLTSFHESCNTKKNTSSVH